MDLEEHLQRRNNANAKKSAELKLDEDKLEAVSEFQTHDARTHARTHADTLVDVSGTRGAIKASLFF